MRLDVVCKGGNDLFQFPPDDLSGGLSQNGRGGSITQGDLILHVSRDHAGYDGREHIVHEVLEFGNFFKCTFEGGKQPSIFNGNRSLVRKRDQQIAV